MKSPGVVIHLSLARSLQHNPLSWWHCCRGDGWMLSRGINLHSFDDEAVAQVSSTQHWCTLCGDHMRRQAEVISTDWTDREEL